MNLYKSSAYDLVLIVWALISPFVPEPAKNSLFIFYIV